MVKTFEVRVHVKCGSCLVHIPDYHTSPDTCNNCGAVFSWDNIDDKIETAYEKLFEWKNIHAKKLPWNKIGPLHITVRVKPPDEVIT